MYSRILVAVDGSEMDQQVMSHAISLAQTSQARLMLVHVLPQSNRGCEQSTAQVDQVEVMRSYWGKVMAAGVLADFRIPCGQVGEEICELAQRWGAELILMGHRSDPDVSLNSISRYVLDHVSCPLLILPQAVEAWTAQLNCFLAVR